MTAAGARTGAERAGEHTPLIRQYLDVKARHPGSILFFRVGDFYEMFFEDAELASRLLGLTLTSRNNGGQADVPLAGIPVKAVQEYLPELVRQGRSVAICEQVEEAAAAEGLVRREVVEVVTPGTVLEDSLLSAGRNHFVAAIAGREPVGIATVDLSTGEFDLIECEAERLADELGRLEPAELLLPAGRDDAPAGRWSRTEREAWRFEPEMAGEQLRRQFGVHEVEGFGLSPAEDGHIVAAAGALLSYLEEVRPAGLGHLRRPRVERSGRGMYLDEMTRRNLELVEPLRGEGGGTLLGVLDRSCTAMGGRMLRRRVLRPLLDLEEIRRRHEAVEELVERSETRARLRERLGRIGDLERLAGKLSTGRAGPRELLALRSTLGALPEVVGALEEPAAPRLRSLVEDFDAMEDLRELIEAAVDPEAPPTLGEGGVIREGWDEELDRLRAKREEGVERIAELQARERERTGIDSLKVGYNKVFGYYLEVSRAKQDRVPEDYIRKQTLSSAERYVTPELKEWEERILSAEEEMAAREGRLFGELRERLAGETGRMQRTGERTAELDVHGALAEVASRNGYVRPEMTPEYPLEIEGGRHPVVERMISREEFIPNDVRLDEDHFLMILTGPNMAGKSTVLRQVGLTVLMAQLGSWVPADRARIGLCDRVFTRVGASDDLTRGQSTFMVEMTETATILNSATRRSLVLLDEIGRGTSTYDGVSIAWAVTEHLHDVVGARTIFATHYHELVQLEDLRPGVCAFNVAVRESGEEILFLRRLEPGGTDRSYGVQVGRLAGLPLEVVRRAEVVLRELENGPDHTGGRLSHLAEHDRGQLTLFEAAPSPALERLREMDPERMTPLEALVELAELKRLAGGEAGGRGPGGKGPPAT